MILIYHANFKPLKSNFSNRLELVNEYLINILSIVLMTFTQFVESNEMRFFMGEVQTYILGLYIFINLIFVLKSLVLSMYLVYRRLGKRMSCRKDWANNHPVKMTPEEITQWEEYVVRYNKTF